MWATERNDKYMNTIDVNYLSNKKDTGVVINLESVPEYLIIHADSSDYMGMRQK